MKHVTIFALRVYRDIHKYITVSAMLGLFTMAVVFEGHHLKALSWLQRLFFLCATVLLLWPSLALHGTGILLFGALYIW